MNILILTNNPKNFENYFKCESNIYLPEIKEKEIINKYAKNDYDFIIFDSTCLNNELYDNLKETNNKKMIYFSQYFDLNNLEECIKEDNIFYLKPFKYTDFN